MGRYLAYGVATNIYISKNRNFYYQSFVLKEHKDKINLFDNKKLKYKFDVGDIVRKKNKLAIRNNLFNI